jgi:hypothetical protein
MLGRMGKLAVLAFLVGCCPWGDMEGIPPGHRVQVGQTVDFRASYGDFASEPASCGGGFWYVNGVLGGNEDVGTIHCGRYVAPARFPEQLLRIEIEVTDWDLRDTACADCCPYVNTDLEPVR